MSTFGEGLTFLDYQFGTRKTAAYAEAEKEPERQARVERINVGVLGGFLQTMIAAGDGLDGYKKWIRDGKKPPESELTREDETSPGDQATKRFQAIGTQKAYVLLGFLSEASEIAEVLFVYLRGEITEEEFMKRLHKEGGDALWYLSETSTEMGWPFALMAQANLDKLADRKARGKIHGDGDER